MQRQSEMKSPSAQSETRLFDDATLITDLEQVYGSRWERDDKALTVRTFVTCVNSSTGSGQELVNAIKSAADKDFVDVVGVKVGVANRKLKHIHGLILQNVKIEITDDKNFHKRILEIKQRRNKERLHAITQQLEALRIEKEMLEADQPRIADELAQLQTSDDRSKNTLPASIQSPLAAHTLYRPVSSVAPTKDPAPDSVVSPSTSATIV